MYGMYRYRLLYCTVCTYCSSSFKLAHSGLKVSSICLRTQRRKCSYRYERLVRARCSSYYIFWHLGLSTWMSTYLNIFRLSELSPKIMGIMYRVSPLPRYIHTTRCTSVRVHLTIHNIILPTVWYIRVIYRRNCYQYARDVLVLARIKWRSHTPHQAEDWGSGSRSTTSQPHHIW